MTKRMLLFSVIVLAIPSAMVIAVDRARWTKEEDEKLQEFVRNNGPGKWSEAGKYRGLNRNANSCLWRWRNHLRSDIRRGPFSMEEAAAFEKHHADLGNRWAQIAAYLPGRTASDIRCYWMSKVRKQGGDPLSDQQHDPALPDSSPPENGQPQEREGVEEHVGIGCSNLLENESGFSAGTLLEEDERIFMSRSTTNTNDVKGKQCYESCLENRLLEPDEDPACSTGTHSVEEERISETNTNDVKQKQFHVNSLENKSIGSSEDPACSTDTRLQEEERTFASISTTNTDDAQRKQCHESDRENELVVPYEDPASSTGTQRWEESILTRNTNGTKWKPCPESGLGNELVVPHEDSPCLAGFVLLDTEVGRRAATVTYDFELLEPDMQKYITSPD